MIEDSDLYRVADLSGEPPTIETPTEAKKPNKGFRLGLVAMLAVIAVIAVIVYTQLPAMRNKRPSPKASPTPAAKTLPEPQPVLAAPVAWERLDVSAISESAAKDLKAGKYYYDNRLPGNFGLAIGYWKQALSHMGEADREGVQNLVTSAENELIRQFSADSADVLVLLKKGSKDEAVRLLGAMRADFLDIDAPQYVWTSMMLFRWRKR
jgi:hypothetical protein